MNLHGLIVNLPCDYTGGNAREYREGHAAARHAAAELARRTDTEIERLTACLKTANDNAERFEREWYLRGDEIERLHSALAWALGVNGDFRQQGTMDGAYWWRGELAERAGLEWDGAAYAPKTPNVLGERRP